MKPLIGVGLERNPPETRGVGSSAGTSSGPVSAPRIGVVRNPKSHRNKGFQPEVASAPDILTAIPQTREELTRNLADFAAQGVELLVIDGFDEDTAVELQTRARECIEKIHAEAIEKARALGVQQSLFDFEGLTPEMFVALGEDGIKTLDDFATCADWELAGGYTTVNGERVKDEGLLEKFDMSLEEAQNLIMTARIQLGWVDPADLVGEEEETEVEEGVEA